MPFAVLCGVKKLFFGAFHVCKTLKNFFLGLFTSAKCQKTFFSGFSRLQNAKKLFFGAFHVCKMPKNFFFGLSSPFLRPRVDVAGAEGVDIFRCAAAWLNIRWVDMHLCRLSTMCANVRSDMCISCSIECLPVQKIGSKQY